MTLQGRLLLLVLLSLLPVGAIDIYNAVALQRAGEADVRRDALSLAQQIRDEQERLIEGVRQVLVLASNTRIVREGDYPACAGMMAKVKAEYPTYLNIQSPTAPGLSGAAPSTASGSTFTTGNTGGRPSIPAASWSADTSCPNAMPDPYCRSPWPTGTLRRRRQELLWPPSMPHG
jgi:hypothetical protein